jgi:hypothetical protein
VLVQYLRDFAQAQERAGRIKYSTTVLKISRPADQGRTGFVLTTTPTDDGASVPTTEKCTVLIVATGLSKANPATNIHGIEHAIGYEDLPPTGESFEGKSVAVLGMGNGAMETADAMGPWVNYVHAFPGRAPRRKPKQQKAPGVPDHLERAAQDPHDFVSWESRYVGNVRAINAGLLDAYLLKSLDGINDRKADNLYIIECGRKLMKRCIFQRDAMVVNPTSGVLEPTISLGRYSPHDAYALALVETLRVVSDDNRLDVFHSRPINTNTTLCAWFYPISLYGTAPYPYLQRVLREMHPVHAGATPTLLAVRALIDTDNDASSEHHCTS